MKRLKVVIFINIVLFVCTATIAYAYFSKNLTFDSNNAFDYNPSENINSDDTTYYEFIDDIYDFYSSIRIHNDYKDTEKIQVNQNNKDSTHVKTLVLNTDLILTADAIITADCHLYLNGKNIDLNSYLNNNYIDYSNSLTRKTSEANIRLNNYLKRIISNTFDILGKFVN